MHLCDIIVWNDIKYCPLIGTAVKTEAELLNQTTEENLDAANQTSLLKEVETMLESMRAVNQTAARNAANQELRCLNKKVFH